MMFRPTIWGILVLLGAALFAALTAACAPGDGQDARADDAVAVSDTVRRLDALSAEQWRTLGVEQTATADSLLLARRLSLALTGTIPSLEEIRALQRLPEQERLDAHLNALLRDRRFADYFAERLARVFVGTDAGPFLVFRRRRFVYWLSDSVAADDSYAGMARKMVAGVGLWTDRPETNYLTAHELDPVQLTARTTRAFLGMRLDCAQCHDHPFSHWKQRDFAQMAAHFSGLRNGIGGVTQEPRPFAPAGRMMVMPTAGTQYAPAVPFAQEALGSGPPRQSFAQWLTSPANPAFGKAIANRVWALMLGRSLTKSGADDIEGHERINGALALLGEDFALHDHRLHRLIRIIAHSRAFSRSVAEQPGSEATEAFAAFGRVKLRPEQLAGALVQLSSLRIVGAESHILLRMMRDGNTRDFVRRYGDLGDAELREQPGTVAERLVLMNGRIVRERLRATLLSASGRIAMLARNDEQRVRTAFLIAFTREPGAAELALFTDVLKDKQGRARNQAMEDMLWAMVNSTEFSWSH